MSLLRNSGYDVSQGGIHHQLLESLRRQLALERPGRIGLLVLLLHEKPFLPGLAPGKSGQRKGPFERPSFEDERELPCPELLLRSARLGRFIGSMVPDHHRAGAVAPLRDDPLKIDVLDRVVRHHHRKPLLGRVHRRPLGDCPRFENPTHLETEVVVQARRLVFMDDEPLGIACSTLRHPFTRSPTAGLSPMRVPLHRGACIMS